MSGIGCFSTLYPIGLVVGDGSPALKYHLRLGAPDPPSGVLRTGSPDAAGSWQQVRMGLTNTGALEP
ncbi:hypothetical protein RSOL_140420, partial [Rhizoctonia solani AG-3 Rhs1AP]